MKIMLAENQHIVREGIKALFARQSDLCVVGEADNGYAAVQLACELLPEIALIEIDLPVLNGIEATRRIATRAPVVHVMALTDRLDSHCVLEMFRAGARGYVSKHCTPTELIAALHTVANHQPYVSPTLAGAVFSDKMFANAGANPSAYTVLTPREREVLQLLAEGLSTKEIASHLSITANTTESYRRQIMEKLNLHSVAALTRYAIREGITPLDV